LFFNLLERYIDKVHRDKLFTIVFADANYENLDTIEGIVTTLKLKSRRVHISKKDGCLQAAILVTGHRQYINQLDDKLLQMDTVKSF
jgi:putative Mg2+ transporter-C (MgtC) family protein